MVVTKQDYQGPRYVDYPLQMTCCYYSVEETAGLHSSFFYAFIENYMAPLSERFFWELPLQNCLEEGLTNRL